ncbi:nucleotidyltransferase domain-containing protein [Terribacillus sp. DMT04]|uniref:nucleotidyltransferase domain-containing protein n=1 Tax=Terribacillus sp. DMT04 TaxID=2850441 RepID=UPI001C2BCEDF|nr:nucleotidyltransferase domain-containing protein [Terribacillus sp. DMT04]QXE02854.1 nucleotidyltransferase domain-containing protein [Terribacillus sp. DMT04]
MQREALHRLTEILAHEKEVKAVFVKGSFGRGEDDAYSDIDLYCLVEESDIQVFLAKRLSLLAAYREVLYSEELFIIAPQLIVVYDNLLHVDLFTVTEENFKQTDQFLVLYDPQNRLEQFKETQTLTMTDNMYGEQVIDLTWFLFQYRKAALRGNAAWAAAMLQQVTEPLARMLLHHYAPTRALLGLKRAQQLLPAAVYSNLLDVLEHVTPTSHDKAAAALLKLLNSEKTFLKKHLKGEEKKIIEPLLECLITEKQITEP